MNFFRRLVALATFSAVGIWVSGCGGSIGSTSTPPPTITSFVASPASVADGASSQLTAVFSNGTGVISPGNVAVTSGVAVTVTPPSNATTVYTLTVTGTSGTTATQTVSIQAVAAPVITSFTANPATVIDGASTQLTAVFANGTGVISPGNVAVTSGVAVSVTPPSDATTVYTLTVTGTGATASQTVSVQAVAAPVITSFTAIPAKVIDGTSTQLTAVFSNGTGVITPGNLVVTNGASVMVTPPSDATTVYTLTVTGTTGATVSQTVSVQAEGAPVITSFIANPATVTNGSGTFLTAYFSNGTGVVTPGNVSVTSGTAVAVTPPSNATTVYTLTVTGLTGTTVTKTVSVQAEPAGPIITVTPSGSVTIGTQQQFTATASGFGTTSTAVTWSVAAPSGSSLSPGDISSTGLYNTPFPAPATVTVTATSVAMPSVSGSVTFALNQPASATGPALTVDVGNQTHAISPDIYGMNAYSISQSVKKAVNLPVDRWGGDATTRYNYQLDVSNAASDWYFENGVQGGGTEANSAFNVQVESDEAVGAKTLGTVQVMGWVAKSGTGCSFPSSTYPNQVAYDPYNSGCGDGMYPDGVSGCTSAGGCNITGNDPTVCCETVNTATWAQGWVSYLVGKFGTAANGGVAIYDLDNEPAWWDAVHRDVHPSPSTYDEVTNNGIAVAEAVKTADATAEVSGPVVDYWWNYFYSKKDIEQGWGTGPCYQPWQNPSDRTAHGGVPFIEYYLQQFKTASATYGARLLDYLDMHTYFAGTYNGSGVGLTTAGDTQEQIVRLNSTRVLWDPTYTDPNYPQPNYTTDSNYTSSCNVPLQAPQLIPMAQAWIAADYPGTKIAFTEYNWGGQENVNGAVAQADILGIFGKYGLDLATLWGPPDPTTQVPGLMAFEIYRNYDGNNSMFGDAAINSNSANQGQLSVYGAHRSVDGAITVMVINKTYGPLSSTLSLEHFTSSSGTAQVYQYSNANLNAITQQMAATVTPPTGSGTTSTINYTFPGQSITLLVIPQ